MCPSITKFYIEMCLIHHPPVFPSKEIMTQPKQQQIYNLQYTIYNLIYNARVS